MFLALKNELPFPGGHYENGKDGQAKNIGTHSRTFGTDGMQALLFK
ncbi:hypothetical protein [Pedobacter sandarakinus]|nr:hypothetical protein [Pedobacter sandarakinus]MCX2573375.1 hypothetical protein [Pedobacter sandarakinus]